MNRYAPGLREGLALEEALADVPDGEQGDLVRELLSHLSQWRLLTRDTGRLVGALRSNLPELLEDPSRKIGILTVLDNMETLPARSVYCPSHTANRFPRGATSGGRHSLSRWKRCKRCSITSDIPSSQRLGVHKRFSSWIGRRRIP